MLLKWEANFGSTLSSCVILGASSVSSKPPIGPWSDGGKGDALLLAAGTCCWTCASTRQGRVLSGRWNLLALVQRFFEPTSWHVLL